MAVPVVKLPILVAHTRSYTTHVYHLWYEERTPLLLCSLIFSGCDTDTPRFHSIKSRPQTRRRGIINQHYNTRPEQQEVSWAVVITLSFRSCHPSFFLSFFLYSASSMRVRIRIMYHIHIWKKNTFQKFHNFHLMIICRIEWERERSSSTTLRTKKEEKWEN